MGGRVAERPCIRCGDCNAACPVGLPVLALWDALRADGFDDAGALGLDACRGCADCDRACPSRIPLAARLAQAQSLRRSRDILLARATGARARHDARAARLQRDAQRQAARDAVRAPQAASADAVAAAIARAKARRENRGQDEA